MITDLAYQTKCKLSVVTHSDKHLSDGGKKQLA